MEYSEEDVKTRNDVVKVANEIITYLQQHKGEIITIVWGKKDSINFLKTWKSLRHKPKMTNRELAENVQDFLKRRFNL